MLERYDTPHPHASASTTCHDTTLKFQLDELPCGIRPPCARQDEYSMLRSTEKRALTRHRIISVKAMDGVVNKMSIKCSRKGNGKLLQRFHGCSKNPSSASTMKQICDSSTGGDNFGEHEACCRGGEIIPATHFPSEKSCRTRVRTKGSVTSYLGPNFVSST